MPRGYRVTIGVGDYAATYEVVGHSLKRAVDDVIVAEAEQIGKREQASVSLAIEPLDMPRLVKRSGDDT